MELLSIAAGHLMSKNVLFLVLKLSPNAWNQHLDSNIWNGEQKMVVGMLLFLAEPAVLWAALCHKILWRCRKESDKDSTAAKCDSVDFLFGYIDQLEKPAYDYMTSRVVYHYGNCMVAYQQSRKIATEIEKDRCLLLYINEKICRPYFQATDSTWLHIVPRRKAASGYYYISVVCWCRMKVNVDKSSRPWVAFLKTRKTS